MNRSWRGDSKPRKKKGKKNRYTGDFEPSNADQSIRKKDRYKRHGRKGQIDLNDIDLNETDLDDVMEEAELTE